MLVTIKKIVPTGKRFVPKDCVGKTGTVMMKVHHHDTEWTRVVFPAKKSFAQALFGNEYYDFLEEELEQTN
jgi:hypothetical protein